MLYSASSSSASELCSYSSSVQWEAASRCRFRRWQLWKTRSQFLHLEWDWCWARIFGIIKKNFKKWKINWKRKLLLRPHSLSKGSFKHPWLFCIQYLLQSQGLIKQCLQVCVLLPPVVGDPAVLLQPRLAHEHEVADRALALLRRVVLGVGLGVLVVAVLFLLLLEQGLHTRTVAVWRFHFHRDKCQLL